MDKKNMELSSEAIERMLDEMLAKDTLTNADVITLHRLETLILKRQELKDKRDIEDNKVANDIAKASKSESIERDKIKLEHDKMEQAKSIEEDKIKLEHDKMEQAKSIEEERLKFEREKLDVERERIKTDNRRNDVDEKKSKLEFTGNVIKSTSSLIETGIMIVALVGLTKDGWDFEKDHVISSTMTQTLAHGFSKLLTFKK